MARIRRAIPLEELPDLTPFLSPSEVEKALVRKKEHDWWTTHTQHHWVLEELSKHFDERSARLLSYYEYYGHLTRAQTNAVRMEYSREKKESMRRGWPDR